MNNDPIIAKALEVIRMERRASLSLFQRRLRMTFAGGVHLIEMLEKEGYIKKRPDSYECDILFPLAPKS